MRHFLFLLALLPFVASGALIYDEGGTDPDLSNIASSPTSLGILPLGESDVELIVGDSGSGADTDYFVVEVGPGTVLTSIYLVDYDPGASSGNVGFLGFQDGVGIFPEFPGPLDISYFLYGSRQVYDPTSSDPEIDFLDLFSESVEATDPALFGSALPAGVYTFWLNETGAETVNVLSFNVEAIPEPSALIFGLVAGGLGLMRRRRAVS